jgi:hypothetical protein
MIRKVNEFMFLQDIKRSEGGKMGSKANFSVSPNPSEARTLESNILERKFETFVDIKEDEGSHDKAANAIASNNEDSEEDCEEDDSESKLWDLACN